MGNYTVEQYIELLEYASEEVTRNNREYNRTLLDDSIDKRPMKKALRYHLFSYSQLLYALKERLKKDAEYKKTKEAKKEIEKFFLRDGVKKLANLWKHDGLTFKQHWSSLREVAPGVYSPSKVETQIPNDNKLKFGDKPLPEVIRTNLKEVKEFCTKK